MNKKNLNEIAQQLVAPGKGILAADESHKTIKKRFESIHVESTEESRATYRGMLFSTPEVEQFISGVILFDETLRQKGSDGVMLTRVLQEKGIFPGIKVDKGLVDLPLHSGEQVTQGLDGLRERLEEYVGLGAQFAKWRAVINIGEDIPSKYCIYANAHALARYAAFCQEAGLVPIVEPEVLINGEHDIKRCEEVTEQALEALFHQLSLQGVYLEGVLLKPSMVISGAQCPVQAGVEEVAERTVKILKRTVPASVPGIVFLSGGQTPERSTEHLNTMNAMGDHPWELSFSYGRALQEPPLNAWAGKDENIPTAQEVFFHRAKCNGTARHGHYTEDLEKGVKS